MPTSHRPTSTTAHAERLLDDACALTDTINDLLAQVATASRQRRELWLRANRIGASYLRIEQRCGVSDTTVYKELARARREHPSLASPPARRRVARRTSSPPSDHAPTGQAAAGFSQTTP